MEVARATPTARLARLVLATTVGLLAAQQAASPASALTASEFMTSAPIALNTSGTSPSSIPYDAAGIGGNQIRRLPLDERSDIERQIEQDMLTAINYERASRGMSSYAFSENLTKIQHRFTQWLSSVSPYVSDCPPGAGGTRSCDAQPPNWNETDWVNSAAPAPDHLSRIATAGLSIGQPNVAGWMVNSLMESRGVPGRQAVLASSGAPGNPALVAGVGVDCLANGNTHAQFSVYTTAAETPQYHTEASTPAGQPGFDSVVPTRFGHRCPRPSSKWKVSAESDGAQVYMTETGNALDKVYVYSLPGPELSADYETWMVRVEVTDAGNGSVTTHEFPYFSGPVRAGYDIPFENYTVPGLFAGHSYTMRVQQFNPYETTQWSSAQSVAVYADSPAPDADVIFFGQEPVRLADTRVGMPRSRVAGGEAFALQIGSPAALNITAVDPAAPGFLAFYPCADGWSGTSSLNFTTGETVANAAFVNPDRNGEICLLAAGGPVDVVVDRTGRFQIPAGFEATTPSRIADTRQEVKIEAGQYLRLPRIDAGAAMLNITVTEPESAGFLSASPCVLGRGRTSVNNFVAGQTKAAMAMIPAMGSICIYASATAHIIVDSFGTISMRNASFDYQTRVLDTRTGDGGQSGKSQRFTVQIPTYRGQAAVLNVTAVEPTAPGYVSLAPCDGEPQITSVLNFMPGFRDVVPNHVVVQPDSEGRVCFSANTPTDLVVDLEGSLNPVD